MEPADFPVPILKNTKTQGDTTMRFMILVPASRQSEAGVMPPKELIAAMGRFNEEMAKAGVMLAGDGLHPTSKGARIKFLEGKTTVTEAPFPESKEIVAGYWIIQVKSKEEAIEWARRAPFGSGVELEIRQIFEASDFPADIMSPEQAARQKALREHLEKTTATA
jgi:hypothetical protein